MAAAGSGDSRPSENSVFITGIVEQKQVSSIAAALQLPTITTFSERVPLPGKRVAIVGTGDHFQQRIRKLHSLPDDHGVKLSYAESVDTEPVEVPLEWVLAPSSNAGALEGSFLVEKGESLAKGPTGVLKSVAKRGRVHVMLEEEDEEGEDTKPGKRVDTDLAHFCRKAVKLRGIREPGTNARVNDHPLQHQQIDRARNAVLAEPEYQQHLRSEHTPAEVRSACVSYCASNYKYFGGYDSEGKPKRVCRDLPGTLALKALADWQEQKQREGARGPMPLGLGPPGVSGAAAGGRGGEKVKAKKVLSARPSGAPGAGPLNPLPPNQQAVAVRTPAPSQDEVTAIIENVVDELAKLGEGAGAAKEKAAREKAAAAAAAKQKVAAAKVAAERAAAAAAAAAAEVVAMEAKEAEDEEAERVVDEILLDGLELPNGSKKRKAEKAADGNKVEAKKRGSGEGNPKKAAPKPKGKKPLKKPVASEPFLKPQVSSTRGQLKPGTTARHALAEQKSPEAKGKSAEQRAAARIRLIHNKVKFARQVNVIKVPGAKPKAAMKAPAATKTGAEKKRGAKASKKRD